MTARCFNPCECVANFTCRNITHIASADSLIAKRKCAGRLCLSFLEISLEKVKRDVCPENATCSRLSRCDRKTRQRTLIPWLKINRVTYGARM